ncbi:uncharacterized protein LOC116033274 [Ipomoea triloba]|uniref:uncharacterized protein LOC116033274 n=1 Tax=Ipomoea triloba TaxID=35885 RepID=UPI00125D0810|nr:uncharacterized protein LOC116033274 [Ipomoea triloba]
MTENVPSNYIQLGSPVVSNVAQTSSNSYLHSTIEKEKTRSLILGIRYSPFRNQVAYYDIGDLVFKCQHCNALFWDDEKLSNGKVNGGPRYSGSLLPVDGNKPKFAQLYIHDPENEITNRLQSVRGSNDIKELHEDIVSDLQIALDENNVLVKSFRMARDAILKNERVDVKMKLIGKRIQDPQTYNLTSVSEVAAIIVGDLDPTLGERDILIETKSGVLKRISELNPAYLPLQYPILVPYGEDGYREDIPFHVERNIHNGARHSVSLREYLSFRIHERVNEISTFLYAKRLFQQFLVDGYTMVESGRLLYIRTHQQSLRCGSYKGLFDALTRGELDSRSQGRRIVLPSSFTGGARYMVQNYQDAMAICAWIGYPNIFITFTCNPKWPEIQRFLNRRNLNAEDRPDIMCRVFKMKLGALIKELRSGTVFGKIVAVEFQKRGLPHAHILLFVDRAQASNLADNVDSIISAEIPNKGSDTEYYTAIGEFMIHGPCGLVNKKSPCMIQGRCSKHFPKKFVESSVFDCNGYPIYRRRDDGNTVLKSGVELDNRFVVPHNRYLLMRYRAHINVEWCNQSRSIKYLFKYVNKGNDRVTAQFYKSTESEEHGAVIDEINMYYDCRYISPCEAAWRLFSFDIQFRNPSVERLSFHLPNEQSIVFDDDVSVAAILERPTIKNSMFLAWFEANKRYHNARMLTYREMPNSFVWNKKEREWQPRKRGFSIGRMFYVPPGTGEIFYLRCLLNCVRCPTSFQDIRTVNGIEYLSFRDACYARGLISDEKEYVEAIVEASQWSTPTALRRLFVTLLNSNSICHPEKIWHVVWPHLCDDAEYTQRRILNNSDLVLSESAKQNYGLVELDKLLSAWSKGLSSYPSMPVPDMSSAHVSGNRLLLEELSYDCLLLANEHEDLVRKLTAEQKYVYDTVLASVSNPNGGLFFVYGYGGTGKTIVWKTLSAALRSKRQIVLNVASSGIASLLMPGGRTAHSRFAIPIVVNEDSTCNISQGSDLAELITKCSLIIWDEAPMMHKHCFEALDKTMRDLLRFSNPLSSTLPFGGKTVVLSGDFRQILPVIPKGSRQQIVGASINSSYLWHHCKVLRLTKNLRLKGATSDEEMRMLSDFSNWIAGIGDGNVGEQNDGYAEVQIPPENILNPNSDPIQAIVDSTFPMFRENQNDNNYLLGRAILAPTLEIVDEVNEYMSSLNVAACRTYYSSDSICPTENTNETIASLHTPELLNGLKCSGLPNHTLTLKVGSPVMLLRNIDHSAGLCNGTRLIVSKLADHVLEAKVLFGTNAGWHNVDKELKDIIWNDVKGQFSIEDDPKRKIVMRIASTRWRDFKSMLKREHLDNKHKLYESPVQLYDYLSEAQWTQFVAHRHSEEFQVLSQECNEHSHFLLPSSSLLSSDRSFDWVRAKLQKSEEGSYYIPNEKTDEVFHKIIEKCDEVSQGTFQPNRYDDILTSALDTS